jgi:uncharacterized protein YlzI (FlbEa/FlbD family)
MIILQLTNRKGGKFYLNAAHIVFLTVEGTGTCLELTDDRTCFCQESLDEIINALRQ